MVSVQAWIHNAINLANRSGRAASLEQVFTVTSLILYFDAIFGVVLGNASDLVTQLLFLASYAILTGLLLTRYRVQLLVFLPKESLLWVMALFPMLSALWSDYPAITLWGGFSVLQASLFGIYLGLRFSLPALLRLLGYTLVGLLGLSILFTIAFWVMGDVSQDSTGIRGVFANPDAFGLRTLLGTVVFLLLALQKKEGRRRQAWVVLCVVSIICVFLSGSSVAQECALVVLAAAPAIAVPRWRKGRAGTIFLFAVTPIFAFTLYALAVNANSLLGVFKFDSPLSSEIAADPEVFTAIKQQFLLGYGYQSFWNGSLDIPSETLSQIASTAADTHLHSGILESMLNVGFIGTLCVCICLWSATLNFSRAIGTRRSPLYFFPILFFCLFLFSNFSEHPLYAHDNIFWVLFVSVLTLAVARGPQKVRLQDMQQVRSPTLSPIPSMDSWRPTDIRVRAQPNAASEATDFQTQSDMDFTVPTFKGLGTSTASEGVNEPGSRALEADRNQERDSINLLDTDSTSTAFVEEYKSLDTLGFGDDRDRDVDDKQQTVDSISDSAGERVTESADDANLVNLTANIEVDERQTEEPLEEAIASSSFNPEGYADESDFCLADIDLALSNAAEPADDILSVEDVAPQDSLENFDVELDGDRLGDEDTVPSEIPISESKASGTTVSESSGEDEISGTLSLPTDAYASLVTAYLFSGTTDSDSFLESDSPAIKEIVDEVLERQPELESIGTTDNATLEPVSIEVPSESEVGSTIEPALEWMGTNSNLDTDLALDDNITLGVNRALEVDSVLELNSDLESSSDRDELSEADTEPSLDLQPELALWSDLESEDVRQPDAEFKPLSSETVANSAINLRTADNVRELLMVTHWLNTLNSDSTDLDRMGSGKVSDMVTGTRKSSAQPTSDPSSINASRPIPNRTVPSLLVNESLLKVHGLKFEVDANAPIFRRLEAAELLSVAQLACVQTLWQDNGGAIATILQQETGLGMRTINFFSDSLWSRHLAERKRIGEYLQDAQLVTSRQVQLTLNSLQQEQKLMPLGVALAEQGLIRQTTADYFARSLVQRAKSVANTESPLERPLLLPMNIEFAETRGGCSICVVTLWGRLERRPHKQLRQELFDIAEQLSPNIVMDMSLVTSADMLALGAIVATANHCRALRGQLCWSGLTADVQTFLRSQSIQLGLRRFPNRRTAVENFPIL
ncbi:MAG: O-antigen ligase family protein [Synechococcus sp.]